MSEKLAPTVDGGEMGALMRAHDWSQSPLGPPRNWPPMLHALVDLILTASQPMFIVWGPARTLFYNDAYAEILASKHPALGVPFDEVWEEIWEEDLAPIVEQAYAGVALHMDDIRLMMMRKGYLEETHFSFSYTPVRNSDGEVQGFLCPCAEITEQVLEERRARVRMEFNEDCRSLSDPEELSYAASELMARHLGVEQSAYAEIDDEGEFAVIKRDWNSGGIQSNTGRHRLADFGPQFVSDLTAGKSVVIGDVQEDPRTSGTAAAQAFAERNIRAFMNVPHLRDGRLVAVVAVHSAEARHWHPKDVALVEEIAQRTHVAVENARTEAARRINEVHLRETRDALALATTASHLGWATWDFIANTVSLDACGREIMGFDKSRLKIDDWKERVHPEDRAALDAEVQESLEEQRPFDLEYRIVLPDGSLRYVHGTGFIEANAAGEIATGTGFVRDATEQKQSEERQNVLLAELDHRVKNILAVVQSIARQSLKRGEEVGPAVAERFIGRISALAQSHSLLASSRWEGASFSDLVENSIAPYRGEDLTRIQTEGPEFNVTPKAAQTLTLALHELVTNAAKYGSLSRPEGRVLAKWEVRGDADAQELVFSWCEKDGPVINAPPSRKGFGTFLIERMLVAELGGNVDRHFAPAGLSTVIQLPFENLATKGVSPVQSISHATTEADAAPVLAGSRILVVEDDYLIGQETIAALEAAGCKIVGPVTSLKEALVVVATDDFNAAVLDINLNGELIWPAAQVLHAREIPFVFTTAYSNISGMPTQLEAAPWVEKPFEAKRLTATLAATLSSQCEKVSGAEER